MTKDEIEHWQKIIDEASHDELAQLKRFAPMGHPAFSIRFPILEYFEERFKELGGMTPEVSRRIGHDKPPKLIGDPS